MSHVSRTTTALLLALVAPLLLALPAAAEEDPGLRLTYPIRSAAPEVIVQVNAGPGSWRIRKAARKVDAQVDGLTIRTSGDCSTADVCVHVRSGRYSGEEMLRMSEGTIPSWAGLTMFTTPRDRIIFLNSRVQKDRGDRSRTAAHELGHVLGFAHHDSPGLMAISHGLERPEFSDAELALLRAWYGNPAARA